MLKYKKKGIEVVYIMYGSLYELIKYLQNGTNLHIGVLFFGSFGNTLCRLPHAHEIHSGRICTEQKREGAGFRRCFRCRNMALKKALEEKKPFGGICVGGIYEYTHPITVGGEVAAVIFIGNIYDAVQGGERLRRTLGDRPDLIGTMEHVLGRADCEHLAAILEAYIRLLLEKGGTEKKKESSLVENVKSYLCQNLAFGASLAGVAAAFHYNKTYLGRVFKKETGLSVSEYINKMRIERATAALLQTDMPIIEISESCGFSCVTYFNRIFKKETGHVPSEIRKKERMRASD